MSVYSIRDLEQLSGIKAHTLRIWEQRYSIVQPKRTDTNIRYYDDEDLKAVLNISMLNRHGFKISHIAEMSDGERHEEIARLMQRQHSPSEQIQALTLAMIHLDEERFEKVLATAVLQIGFERAMMELVYPFLTRVGVLWQTGAIRPSQEHFISHLIRQKLIVAIDGQVSRQDAKARRFLLFLPEGELHELSLLFACYLVKSRGHRAIYLGQSLPMEDLKEVYTTYQPHYLMFVATTSPTQDQIQGYIDALCGQFLQARILLTGYQVIGQDLHIPANGEIIHKIEDLVAFIENLHP
jgi:DNA-binding transcriptional MerR regulator